MTRAPWLDALVDVEGNRRNLERRPLGLPGPDKLRVKVRIVGVGSLAGFRISFRVTSPAGGLFVRFFPLCS